MSPPKDSERGAGTTRNGRGRPGDEDPGILSQLPRTRPQRSSRHRAAARDGSVAEAASTATSSAANGDAPAAEKPRSARTGKTAAPRSRAKAARPSAKQGAQGSAGAGAGADASTKARRVALRRNAAHAPLLRAALPRRAPRRRLPGRDSSARASEQAGRCIHREAQSWWRPPPRSSASSPRPGCPRESACSKTCSRACRSEPARPKAGPRQRRSRRATCILPRNAEPLRLRSRWAGDPTRIDVDPLGRIGPAGP